MELSHMFKRSYKTSTQAVTAQAVTTFGPDLNEKLSPSERRAKRQEEVRIAERHARFVERYKGFYIELTDPESSLATEGCEYTAALFPYVYILAGNSPEEARQAVDAWLEENKGIEFA